MSHRAVFRLCVSVRNKPSLTDVLIDSNIPEPLETPRGEGGQLLATMRPNLSHVYDPASISMMMMMMTWAPIGNKLTL
jgi:hypothetical protein